MMIMLFVQASPEPFGSPPDAGLHHHCIPSLHTITAQHHRTLHRTPHRTHPCPPCPRQLRARAASDPTHDGAPTAAVAVRPYIHLLFEGDGCSLITPDRAYHI